MKGYNFELRFGLVNSMNTYLLLIYDACNIGRISSVLIKFAIPNLNLIFIMYIRNHKYRHFAPFFLLQNNHLNLSVCFVYLQWFLNGRKSGLNRIFL